MRREKERRDKFHVNNCKQLHSNDGLPKMKVKAVLIRKAWSQKRSEEVMKHKRHQKILRVSL
jgi:hypothetical protein